MPLVANPAGSSPEPLVSIIVRTCGNRQHLLRECLLSIGVQDYPHLEINVVEDGTSNAGPVVDGVRSTIRFPINYRSIPKSGRCVAGNVGLQMSTGSYFNFLDDDDQFLPNHVLLLATALSASPEVDAVYGGALEVPTIFQSLDPLQYTEGPRKPCPTVDFSRARLWYENFLPIQSIMFRRELFERYGGFDLELDMLEDWNLWNRYFTTSQARRIDAVTSFFRMPGDPEERRRRSAAHDRYIPIAARKRDELPISLTIGEVLDIGNELWKIRIPEILLLLRLRQWLTRGPVRRTLSLGVLKTILFGYDVLRNLAPRKTAAACPSATARQGGKGGGRELPEIPSPRTNAEPRPLSHRATVP
jgi:glycosyltransferase involved in cell wall biosynthesis